MTGAHALAHGEQKAGTAASRGGLRANPYRENSGSKNGGCSQCAAPSGPALGVPWRRPAGPTSGNTGGKNGACGCGGSCGACGTQASKTGNAAAAAAPVVAPPAAGAAGLAAGAAAGAAAGVAAAACPAAQKSSKATACIQPVVIAKDDGTEPTTAPSFDKVKSIWKKCCIDYTVNGAQTVKKTAFRTLDESPNNTPTAEESALFAAAGSSACIQVFVPVEFAQGGTTGKGISGGGGTYEGGGAHPKIVVVEGAASEVVAHEVGHASGYGGHDANNTVMKPTGAYNVANSTDVSPSVCSTARTGAVLSTGGASDCCQSVK